MRRADRLFRVVQMLRSGRMLTGAQLASKLEVSTRTLYRDIADLQANGVMIEGEAGVGYTLRRDMDLPPMQFTAEEMTALVLGARMAFAWGGEQTGAAAKDALRKIEAVLPAPMRAEMDMVQMYAPTSWMPRELRQRIDALHGASVRTHIATFIYEKLDGAVTSRRVWPLALVFWGGVWTLAAWCEKREDFRNFRLDRMREVVVLDEIFTPKRGQRLKDYMRIVVPEKELKKMGLIR
jgi:predicted DNA-binding transcriptional regulator YafY